MERRLSNSGIEKRIRELQENGYWFWSVETCQDSADAPLLKSLRATRDSFVSILRSSDPQSLIKNLLNPNSPLTKELAIKHAMTATDASAEILDRTKSYISFKNITVLHAKVGDQKINYDIRSLGHTFGNRLTNEKIASADDPLLQDLLFVICFGSVTQEFRDFVTFKRFRLAELSGNLEKVEEFFQTLYLDVSRQTTQLSAQARGEAINNYVKSSLDSYFTNSKSIGWVETRRVPNTGDRRARELGGEQFDLVYSVQSREPRKTVYVAIEVAFQETTNSTMERKARQAPSLFRHFMRLGNKLCFVVDGAGFLSARPKALRDIIQNSHLTVTTKPAQLAILASFVLSLAT